MLVSIVSRGLCGLGNGNGVVTGQEKISARSGERQGKLIFFDKNSRIVEIITLLMKGWKKHFK